MSNLICNIPNHGYSDEDLVYVSWLDQKLYVQDATSHPNSFTLSYDITGYFKVSFLQTVTEGYVRKETGDTASVTITGLEHLEGKQVAVTSGGLARGRYIVASGQITITDALTTYQVGLPYEATLIPMDIDIQGTGYATTKRPNRVVVNILETTGGKIGQDANNLEVLSSSTTVNTGLKEISLPGGYTRDTDVVIKQDEPLPMTILSITYDMGASND